MKHILAQAPVAVAALFVVACASSQKNLTGPQQAALQAEEQSQKAQDEAQKAREAANKTQGELKQAQAAHADAQREEIQANARAQQASYNAGRAEAAAGMASHPAAPPQGAPGAQPGKGVAETQGAGAPSSPGKVVVITTSLLFPTGSSKLSDSAKPDLDRVADALKQQQQGSDVFIEGHTDNTGSMAANMKLSQERAQTVADYLQSKGVPKDHIKTKGVGPQDPASHANTTEGRAVNRRVDVQVEENKGAAEKQGSPEKQGTGTPQGQQQPKEQPSQQGQPMQQGPGTPQGQPQQGQPQQYPPNQQWQPKDQPNAPDGTGPQHPIQGGQPQTYH